MTTPSPEEIAASIESLRLAEVEMYLKEASGMFASREDTELPAEMVLGSKSPRREVILGRLLGVPHNCVVVDAEETVPSGSHTPDVISKCLAVQKHLAYADSIEQVFEVGNMLLVGDTIVVGTSGDILGKEPDDLASPKERYEFCRRRMLNYLGNPVRVYSSVVVADFRLQRVFVGCDSVTVHFRKRDKETENLVEEYCRLALDAGNKRLHRGPVGKAGSFGIQEPEVLMLVEKVEGDITVAVGLPASLTVRILRQLPGFPGIGDSSRLGYSAELFVEEVIGKGLPQRGSDLDSRLREHAIALVSGAMGD